jgi:hypothetical protein
MDYYDIEGSEPDRKGLFVNLVLSTRLEMERMSSLEMALSLNKFVGKIVNVFYVQ